jgi:putative spermidine/putrescine transport system substrate-binding protein
MGEDASVVIPKEASVAAPYAISLVKNCPHPNAGKLWLNWTLSDAGQSIFADGFVRPSVPGVGLSADAAAKMPTSPQVVPLDLVKAAERKNDIDQAWTKAVLGK